MIEICNDDVKSQCKMRAKNEMLMNKRYQDDEWVQYTKDVLVGVGKNMGYGIYWGGVEFCRIYALKIEQYRCE
jgi:hypothetical protein